MSFENYFFSFYKNIFFINKVLQKKYERQVLKSYLLEDRLWYESKLFLNEC